MGSSSSKKETSAEQKRAEDKKSVERSDSSLSPNIRVEIIMLGLYLDCGQQELLQRFFAEPVASCDFKQKIITVKSRRVQLQISSWFGTGSIGSAGSYKTDGVCMCYDVSKRETYDELDFRLDGVIKRSRERTKEKSLQVLAIKRDVDSEIVVDSADGHRYAQHMRKLCSFGEDPLPEVGFHEVTTTTDYESFYKLLMQMVADILKRKHNIDLDISNRSDDSTFN
eukprot:TRINITY_DN4049_c0_g1_i1.p1 TRINITY_DN4049_c0_g1~~TRINITY_DN4049_c0_g1_i1.p1  ORF type:complete len:225 (+),score=29.99 TRINITY_DN4049_c0_g1_i1:80-754(+)